MLALKTREAGGEGGVGVGGGAGRTSYTKQGLHF